jgi:hypothetical protein
VLAAAVLAGVALMVARPAHAQRQADVALAATAFADAQRAEVAGQPARAAKLYELADRLVPDPAALRSAARAHYRAGHHATAARLAAALRRRDPDGARSTALAHELLSTLEPRLLRLRVRCEPGCALAVDGQSVDSQRAGAHIAYAAPGQHRLTALFANGEEQSAVVHGKAGGSLDLRLQGSSSSSNRAGHGPPLPAWDDDGHEPPADEAPWTGLSPAWFAVASGGTVAFGVAAIWSGVDQLEAGSGNSSGRRDSAENATVGNETRTTVLIGATAVAALGTGVIALCTDWGSGDAQGEDLGASETADRVRLGRPVITAAPTGAVLSWNGYF